MIPKDEVRHGDVTHARVYTVMLSGRELVSQARPSRGREGLVTPL